MRKLLGMGFILLVSIGLLAQAPTGGVSTAIRSGASLPSGAAVDSLFIVNGAGLYKCNVNPCTTASNWTKMAEVDATGKLTIPTVTANSVCDGNSPIDVIACYGAKGDCVTDDHNAILNALNAAYSSTPIRAVKFNRPPGGCYLTSTLPWLGVSLIGVPSGQGNASAWQRIVQIRGKPGQDVFNFPDPNDVASPTPYEGYVVQDIEIVVDDSVDVSSSHPNRKVGRTISDAAMTSGSAVLTSATQGQFTGGDVGQQIYVGSVTSGGLLTTIASYQSATQVTLAASATITASGATAYISIAGISANATVGNCAFAVDNRDGNNLNWLTSMQGMNQMSNWENVTIRSLSGAVFGQNSSCGIYFQPWGNPYNQVWRNSRIDRLVYDFTFAPYTVNPAIGNVGVGADYFQWYGGYIGGAFPFIFYNGGDNRIDQVQICAANKPEVLAAYSSVETYPGDWHVHIPEDECQTTGAGWRLEGRDHHFEQTELGGASSPSFPVLWDATNSNCTECDFTGNIQINGNANRLEKLEQGDNFTVTDNGYGNRVVSSSLSILAASPNRRWAKSITREETVGNKRGDFIQRGLSMYPYNNDADTWLWPSDFSGIYGTYGAVTSDSTSDSGQYLPFYGSGGFLVNTNFTVMNGGTRIGAFAPTIGTVWPASKVTAYIKGKCPAGETITGTVYAVTSSSGQTAVGYISGSCTSSYGVVAAVPMDLTSYAGDTLSFSVNLTSEFDIAWVAIRPWNGDVLVAGPVQHWASSGAYVGTEAQPTLTANRTWTWPDVNGTVAITGGNIPTFNLPLTRYDLCGSLDGTSVTCGYNPETITYPPSGSTLAGSTVTFSWTPAVGSTSYYVHLGTTPGASDLVNATAASATSYTATGIPVLGNTVYLTVVPTVGIGGQATATYTEASSSLTANYDVQANSGTTFKNSTCDHGVTTANTMTCSDTGGIKAASFQTPGSVAAGTIVPTTPIAVANGGTGTATPALVPGTNVTITGTWPNQTVNSTSGGSMVYPGAGLPVSTGSAWGTSKAAPVGAVVGTTDTQTIQNKTLDTTNTFPTLNQNTTGTAANLSGTPALPNGTAATTQTPLSADTKLATDAYADAAVGVEQARAGAAEATKAPSQLNALVATTCPGSALTMNTRTVVQASSACTIPLPAGTAGVWAAVTAGTGYAAVTITPPSGTLLLNGVPVSSVTIPPESNATIQWSAGSQYLVTMGSLNPAVTTVTVGTTNPVTIGGATGSCSGKVANADGTGCTAMPTVPAASSTTPVMDGTAAIGSAATYAKADHVHPTDTSRAPVATTTVSSGAISQTSPNQYVICTTTCTVTPLTPTAGEQICVRNGPGVSTAITLAALGAGNYYELTSHASWGTANHTVVSGGAATDSICLVGYDANHYAVFSYNGTWTD